MTLPLLMDLANYWVSGAAPRLLGPRQNEMRRRNRGSENIQISIIKTIYDFKSTIDPLSELQSHGC